MSVNGDSPEDESTAAIRCISPDDEGVDLAQASLIDVQCGSLTGKLHMERFTCPGIHQQCIEYEGCMMTPKEFTVRANKDRQKDWKGSIRIGKSNLRVLMEMKTLDFYQHDTYCSAKCQSRNYMAINKAEIFTNSGDFPEQSSPSSSKRKSPPTSSTLQQLVAQSLGSQQLTLGNLLKLEESPCTSLELINGHTSHQQQNGSSHHTNIARMMAAQPGQFWAQMHHLGIFSDLLDDIVHTIEQMRLIYPLRSEYREEYATKLSQIAQLLDLGETFSERIHAKRLQTVFESNILSNELKELQRKAEEQKRKQEEARRRAQLFDSLLSSSNSESPPSSKMSRKNP